MINYSAIDPDFPGEKLLAGLRAVEARYGIHLTLHDCRGLLCHADGRPFFPDRCMHMHPYCITGRFEMPGWNRRCHEECKLRVEANADRLRRPFLHHCWKGVTELVVPLLREAAGRGVISAYKLATLEDRVAMYEERPQRYVTQSYQTNVGGETVIYVWPVEHPEQLDSLREAIGTCPMAEYVRLLEETSGAQVVYDPALTVDSLKRIVGRKALF